MHVALIGAEFEENLAVRYLRGALEHAGHQVSQIVFNSRSDTEAAAHELLASGAELAGLSMVFTYRAREFARLATRVRELGFRGHIVAGGHFAAFHPELLLRDVPAIDSVAIGEGEELICALAREPSALGDVRGLVWRDGESLRRNPAADKLADLDELPHPPRKQPLDDYMGIPITNILSSRGCAYSCTFCSIVAWHRLCGGDRVRMRRVECVADEMAKLYRAGARIFNFHDDNFFLPEREAMLGRIQALQSALEARGVERIAFAIKARPDAVDREIFQALKRLGLFRVFLGIEAGTPTALKQLGRRQTVEQNEQALEVMNALDIHTAFNLLIFNPDSTLEDVADNVAFLRKHPHNPMNFCRTEIYAGTPLETKLRKKDRLLGDYWGYDYVMADPRAQLAFEVVYRAFRTRNYGDKALHHQAMAVDYEHQLASHFFGTPEDLHDRVKAFIVRVNHDTAEHLDDALSACGAGFESTAAREAFERELGPRVESANRRLGAEAETLLAEIRRRAMPREAPSAWGRAARAVGIAASVTIAATGCKKSGEDTFPTEMAPAPPTAPTDTHPTEMVAAPPEEPDAAADTRANDAGAAADDASTGATPIDAGKDAAAKSAATKDAGKPKPPPTGTHRHEMAPRPTHPTEMAPAPPDDD